jgi:hypothetical protein
MISARSRRLRTIALLLLGIVLAMTAYGYLVLMPNARGAVQRHHALLERAVHGKIATPGMTPEQIAHARQVVKAVKIQVVFTYCYWSVCGLILIAVLCIGWLDMREISRLYMSQRLAIWSDVAAASRNDRSIE